MKGHPELILPEFDALIVPTLQIKTLRLQRLPQDKVIFLLSAAQTLPPPLPQPEILP